LPGVLTALATLITAIGGAFLGGTQVVGTASQPTVTVTVTPSVPAARGSGNSGSGSQSQANSASAPGGTTDLSALTPVQNNTGDPLITGAQQIGTATYANSVRFTCPSFAVGVVYEVAGYKILNATIGVPSNAQNGAGTSANITFLKDAMSAQLAPGVNVALDQPQRVHVNLHGASQLEISCTASGPSAASTVDVALGDATVSPS
jgi:hypothetical protein